MWCFTCFNQGLILAHDDIAAKNYDESFLVEEEPMSAVLMPQEMQMFPGMAAPTDAIRMVGIRKNADEPLVCYSHTI